MWIAVITPVLISLGVFSLLLAALIVFAETGLLAGFFLPGDGLLFTMGVLTASGLLPVPIGIVLVVLTLAAVAGDCVGYAIGRRLGPAVFSRPKSRIFNPAHLAKAECFIARHGHGAVVLARFIPWARTFVPVVAGAGSMPRATFVRVNVTGAVAWVFGVTLAGYALGQVPVVADNVRWATFLIGMVTLWPVLGVKFVKGRRARRRLALAVPVVPAALSIPALVG